MRTRPLAELGARELRHLLQEEVEHWERELSWDYGDVSQAVAAGIDRRALNGRVAEEAGRPLGYCYSMRDAGRAVVGSVFVTAGARGRGLEEQLVAEVVAEAQAERGNERVECQTLFCTASGADQRFREAGFASRPRHYMARDLRLPLTAPDASARLRPLRREDLTMAADIVYRSHRGTLDAALNLTYATPGLCRSFVETLVLRAGCGRFDPDASFLAEAGGRPAGVLIASRLSGENGHVCQVSVIPDEQARGLGTALLQTAMASFRRERLRMASLSVTVGNRRAYELYERLGFRAQRVFAAHAWVRPPARVELVDPGPGTAVLGAAAGRRG